MTEIQTNHQILISKYIKGLATDAEVKQLLEWVNKNPGNEQLFIKACKNWEAVKEDDQNYLEFLDLKWSNYQTRFQKETKIQKSGKTRFLNAAFRYAAIFILIVGIASLAHHYVNSRLNDYNKYVNELSTHSGNENNLLILSDGAKVKMDSKESFVDYNADGTEIKLDSADAQSPRQILKNPTAEEKRHN